MDRVGLVVLAAGASRRMGGRPKALLALPGGETFLGRILRVGQAAGVTDAVVVLGPPHGEQIQRQLQSPLAAVTVAWNPAPERGMLSSAQLAAAALAPEAARRGTLLWPVDLPLVEVATVRRLLAAAAAAPDQMVIPVVGEDARGGHPIWVPGAMLPALQGLSPESDQGIRGLRLRFPEKILRIVVDDPGVLRDVDTPTELAAVLAAAPGT